MSAAHCDPCRRLRNLCDRKRRSGKPTNLRFAPCASCRETENARRRQGGPKPRPSQAIPPDEQMVYRLLGGPDAGATRGERQAAIAILLQRKPRPAYREIAARVGVNLKTVERHAAKLRSGTV